MFACCLILCCECVEFPKHVYKMIIYLQLFWNQIPYFPEVNLFVGASQNLSSPLNTLFGFIMFQSISETFMLLSKLLFTLLIWNSCSRPIIIDSSLPGFLFCFVWAQTHHRRQPAKGRPHLVSAVLSNVLSYSDSTSGRPGSQVQLDDHPKTHLGR